MSSFIFIFRSSELHGEIPDRIEVGIRFQELGLVVRGLSVEYIEPGHQSLATLKVNQQGEGEGQLNGSISPGKRLDQANQVAWPMLVKWFSQAGFTAWLGWPQSWVLLVSLFMVGWVCVRPTLVRVMLTYRPSNVGP